MRDHADTIRREAEDALAQTWAGGDLPVGPSVPDAFRESVRREKYLANAALALLAERQQLQQQLQDAEQVQSDQADVPALVAELGKCRAERQQAQEECEAASVSLHAQADLRHRAEEQRQQAIDALRREVEEAFVAGAGWAVPAPSNLAEAARPAAREWAERITRAALVKIGEQP